MNFNILYHSGFRGLRVIFAVVLWPFAVAAQTITTFAGTGAQGYSGDTGAPSAATLNNPAGVFADTTGALYIADTGNHVIRRINAAGDTITTIAGTGTAGFSGDDSTATNAQLNAPAAVFVDSTGLIYVADTGNHRIRRISTTGGISTIAGTGSGGFFGDDSTATLARLNAPAGVYVDSGLVYIADTGNHRIRRISSTSVITTIAGDSTAGFFGDDSTATKAHLNSPSSVFVTQGGDMYIADTGNHRIRKVSAADTVITTVAGNGMPGYSGDGDLPTNAQLAFPKAAFVDSAGTMLIIDQFNQRLRRVNPGGNITTIAGDGTFDFSGDGGPSTHARIASPSFLTRNPSGNIYLADAGNHRIRKIVPVDAEGLAGTTRASPGTEVQVLRVALTGDGATSVSALRFTLSDLDSTTGLAADDLVELRLYESADSTFGSGDILLGTLSSSLVTLGSETTLTASSISTPGSDIERQYIATVLLDSTASEGHGFKVGFDTGDLATSKGGRGFGIAASDSNRVLIDVVANKLRFSTQPAGSISGIPFSTQPVVMAIDSVSGFVDSDFADTVTVATSKTGTLINNSTVAGNGIATFSSLTYTTSIDDEKFNLVADDQAGGAEGNLASVGSDSLLANVVNDVPVVDVPNLTMSEDDSIGFITPIVTIATDPDDAVLTFTFVSKGVEGKVVGDQIQITPAPNYFGVDTLTVIATDSFGAQGMDTGIITVFAVNDPPVVLLSDSLTVAEDDTLLFNLPEVATDVDNSFDELIITINPSSGLQTNYDSTSGVLLAWAPPDSSGSFTLDLAARDLFGVTDRDTVLIVVASINDTPVFSVPDTSVLQTDTLLIDLRSLTIDIDTFDTLSWQAELHPDLAISVDANGLIQIIPTFGSAGAKSVIFSVVDQSITVSDTAVVTVIQVNQPPVLAAFPDTLFTAGDTLSLNLQPFATDPDNAVGSLGWQVAGGTFVGAAIADDILDLWALQDTAVVELLQVIVTDPTGLSDTSSIQVELVVLPPLIDGVPDEVVDAGKILEIPLGSFLRSDVVSIGAMPDSVFEVFINTSTRIATVEPVDNWKGTAAIVFTASTAAGDSGRDTVMVTVANPAPVITPFRPIFIDAGTFAQLSLDVFVEDDEDLSKLTWTAFADPGVTAEILAEVSTLKITAESGFMGETRVALTVRDAQNATDSDTLIVTVQAPIDTSPPDTTGPLRIQPAPRRILQ